MKQDRIKSRLNPAEKTLKPARTLHLVFVVDTKCYKECLSRLYTMK